MFGDELKAKGWTEITEEWEYAKGDWKIEFDTGHWMIVSTAHNPRVFSVPAPQELDAKWTVKLIEHLCRMDDERHRLRDALARISGHASDVQEVRTEVTEALRVCYHSWLVDLDVPEGQMGRIFCSVSGEKGHSERLVTK
jgi:hypothetical protein